VAADSVDEVGAIVIVSGGLGADEEGFVADGGMGGFDGLGFEGDVGVEQVAFERGGAIETPVDVDDALDVLDFEDADGAEQFDDFEADGEVLREFGGGHEDALTGELVLAGIHGNLGFPGDEARERVAQDFAGAGDCIEQVLFGGIHTFGTSNKE